MSKDETFDRVANVHYQASLRELRDVEVALDGQAADGARRSKMLVAHRKGRLDKMQGEWHGEQEAFTTPEERWAYVLGHDAPA